MKLWPWRKASTTPPSHADAVKALHDLEKQKAALDRYDHFANSQDNDQFGPNGTGAVPLC